MVDARLPVLHRAPAGAHATREFELGQPRSPAVTQQQVAKRLSSTRGVHVRPRAPGRQSIRPCLAAIDDTLVGAPMHIERARLCTCATPAESRTLLLWPF